MLEILAFWVRTLMVVVLKIVEQIGDTTCWVCGIYVRSTKTTIKNPPALITEGQIGKL